MSEGLPFINRHDALVVIRGSGEKITKVEAFATAESGVAGELAQNISEQLSSKLFPFVKVAESPEVEEAVVVEENE